MTEKILMAGGVEAPERTSKEKVGPGHDWIVTVFNNDVNTYEEVMTVLILATACDQEEAYIEAWEIDHFGQCVVHRADENECRLAAEVIATIGIRVEASPES
ncbi:MAG: ATP-dependent Clp protease adaptor ClpS [Fimbriimonadaceae bacterium]|nr:ATP-dependent Clp protease adaptor ClpS [Fimbriimonadaceae bacterium]QYK55759.1 MAG: ATP-dependent Clp protease adaptor ClpS [Fimbriimonadaceae bacterium]